MISTATKLYPPILDGKLPAQYGDTLVIPYRLNVVHDFEEIGAVVLQIKTVYSNQIITLKEDITTDFKNQKNNDPDTYYAIFPNIVRLEESLLNEVEEKQGLEIGQYYKVQIAFLSKGNESQSDKDNFSPGNYSSTGIFKYTGLPEFGIAGLNVSNSNNNIYHYIGEYKPHEDDPAEKPYFYRFDFYKENNELLESSGDIFSNDYWLTKDLEVGKLYVLNFTIKTVNNLTISKRYVLQKRPGITVDYPFNFNITPNHDEGYNNIIITSTGSYKGYYRLLRSTDQVTWDELSTFGGSGETNITVLKYFDNTVEHGMVYYYAIQQFDDVYNVYAEKKIYEKSVINNFEDIFLSDGERQLKIRFNPKVSSYKITTLEQKTDTIGGKYPYFFRNGVVGYREIPVSGLISLLMDEAHLFVNNMTGDESIRNSTPGSGTASGLATNLSSENVYNERIFKMQVLDWLNNGKAKIFRSPTEGCAIVRLNNVSMSPEEQLGRMLHNFSCTAYEIKDYNFRNIKELDLALSKQELQKVKQSITLKLKNSSTTADEQLTFEMGVTFPVQNGFNARIDGAPFVKATLELDNGEILRVIVGSTGTYRFNLLPERLIKTCLLEGPNAPGSEFREPGGYGWGENSMPYPTFSYDTYDQGVPLKHNGKFVKEHLIYQRPFQVRGTSLLDWDGWMSKHKKYTNLSKILYLSIEINPLVEEMDAETKKNIKTADLYSYQFEHAPEKATLQEPRMAWKVSEELTNIPKIIYLGKGLIANFFAEYEEIKYEEE